MKKTALLVLFFFLFSKPVFATNISDFRQVLSNLTSILNLNSLIADYGKVIVPISSEWTQFGHDAQHTGYTSQTVSTPWKFAWQFNGSNASGGVQSDHKNVADLIQPITGGGQVYYVAADTIYALNKTTGAVVWSRGNLGSITATPAYYNSSIFIGSNNGNLYKLSATNGSILGTVSLGDPAPLAITQVGNMVYIPTQKAKLVAVNTDTMAITWTYTTGNSADYSATPVSYSSKYNTLVYNVEDRSNTFKLIVHAVNVSNGSRKWIAEPTARKYQCVDILDTNSPEMLKCNVSNTSGGQFSRGWPVIAEEHGVVLIKVTLDWWAEARGPGLRGIYATTNAGIIDYLTNTNPNDQTLFVLNLSDGSKTSWIPAVGSVTAMDGGTSRMGPQPIVKIVDGKEVVYTYWRNGQICAFDPNACDGRWDSGVGEMVLDDTSATGCDTANGVCKAGYVRFVQFKHIPGDEIMYTTMSGSTFFENHWLVSSGSTISNRSGSYGYNVNNPIPSNYAPHIAWALSPEGCSSFSSSHYCAGNVVSFGANEAFRRYWPQGGFYVYHNDWCTLHGTCPVNTNLPYFASPFTVVSDGLVLVKSTDGALVALKNGEPLASLSTFVMGAATSSLPLEINYHDAAKYVDKDVKVSGIIDHVSDHLPKAYYFVLSENGEKTGLLFRIFSKDLYKFNYDVTSLVGKKVTLSGKMSLYPPDGVKPEMIITDPSQIEIK